MNAQEKKILEKITGRLRSVSTAPFSSGDLKAWSGWANTMQTTIHSTVSVLEGLVESSVYEGKPQSEEDFLAKNLP